MNISSTLLSTATGALVCCLAASGAAAQTAPAPQPATAAASEQNEFAPDDIVVTAQKRGENVLKVPVPVTAIDAGALTKQNLVQLQDFATRVPSLSVSGPSTSDISIRGLNAGGATSPTVAVTVDDVPFGSTSWAGNSTFPDLDPAEIERIEVLRGPQGTLYGAASLGGLIKYVTKDADPNHWSGRVSATGSTVDSGTSGYAVRGSLNVPIVRDVLGVRVSGYKRRDPSLIDHYTTAGALIDSNVDKVDVDGFRVAAYLHPFDALTIKASHLEQNRDALNSGATDLKSFSDLSPRYDWFGTNNSGGLRKGRVRLTQLIGELDLGGVSLTSVSGWGESSVSSNTDVSNGFRFVFTGIPGFVGPIYPNPPAGAQVRLNDGSKLAKFSQEVRLASTGDSALSWTLGGFYTNERASLDQDLYAADASGGRIGLVVAFPLPSTFKEYAVFGDLTYRFSDRFKLQVGGRYSENDQTYQANQTVPNIANALFLFGPSATGAIAKSHDSSFTFVVSPQFQITDTVMAYARVASGYRPGGPNSAIAPQKTFDADTVTNYELGLKGRFFDRKLTLDASLFNIEWRKVQLGATTAAGVSYFTNGGDARSRGLELSAEATPGHGWIFTGNVTLADAQLRDDLPASTGLIGKSGDPLPFSAKFSSNVGFEKSWALFDDFKLTVGGNYNHVGQRDTDYRSRSATVPVGARGKLQAPAYDVVDARIGFGNKQWDVTAFVRNLFNERGFLSLSDGGGTNPNPSALVIQPRTIGVDLSFQF